MITVACIIPSRPDPLVDDSDVFLNDDGTVSFQAIYNNKYLKLNGYRIEASGTIIDDQRKFVMTVGEPGEVVLLACS